MATILTLLTLGILKFFIVKQGTTRVIMRFGKFHRAAPPGIGACASFWGLVQRLGPEVSLAEQIDPYDREMVFTADGVKCFIDVIICYKVTDPCKALFEVSNYRDAIKSIVQAVLRNECGKLPARILLSGREQLTCSLRTALEKDAAPWGVAVRLVEIKNIDISVQEKRG
jgi:regulator of protease activity HflC (stomatin/prohibitin superfamily)